MADLKFIAQTAEIALGAATELSLIQLSAPANQRVKVLGWGISFDGVETTILATPADTTTTAPVAVELLTGTVGGTYTNTMTSSDSNGSITPTNGVTDTVQSVLSSVATVEPTATGVVDVIGVAPTSSFEKTFDEPFILSGGSFITITATAPAIVNARVKLICEE